MDFESFGDRLDMVCRDTTTRLPESGQPSPMTVIFDYWSRKNKVVKHFQRRVCTTAHSKTYTSRRVCSAAHKRWYDKSRSVRCKT